MFACDSCCPLLTFAKIVSFTVSVALQPTHAHEGSVQLVDEFRKL